MSDIIARQTLARMHNREQAIAPQYEAGFSADMSSLANVDPVVAQEKFMNQVRAELCEAYGLRAATQNKPFAFSNGIAIIPVHGSLINRFGGCYSFLTGYNFIRAQHNAALVDPDVTHIVHDHNSFGGEVAGCFELGDDIYNSRGEKPIIAMVDSNCYSAAYAVASAADRIIITPSSGVGSIGVRAMHVDMSQALKADGVKVTFIYSGDHKVDGNPYEALPASVKADIQKGVDKSRALFVAHVARNRGIDSKIVYDTEAQSYRAEEALQLKLVDAIAAPAAALELIMSEDWWDTPDASQEDANLSTTENTMATPEDLATLRANAAAATAALATAEAAAAASAPAAPAAAPAAAAPAAAAAAAPSADTIRAEERARVSGITTSEHAVGREKMANHLAMNTNHSVADAVALLQVAPKEGATTVTPPAAAAAPNVFEQAMSNAAHPKVGADGQEAAGGDNKGQGQAETMTKLEADYFAATGRKLDKL